MNTKSSDFPVKLSLVLMCITAFFYAMIGNGYLLLAISLIPIVPHIFSHINKIESNSSIWILFIVLAVASSLFSEQLKESVKFVLMITSFFAAKLVLQKEFGWWSFFSRIIYLFSAFNVVGVLLLYFIPDYMLNFAFNVYSGENLEMYIQLLQGEAYPGWNAQTSLTGFFVSIFIAYIVCDIFNNPKKAINYFLFAVSLITLFLTKKRSFLIANIVSVLVLFWRSGEGRKNGINRIVIVALFVAIVYFIVYYSAAGQNVVEKWLQLEQVDDISNGRFISWNETYNIWKNAPVFGVGTNVLVEEYGVSTHNVYLQLLAEMGILGAVAYIMMLWSSLKQAFTAYDNTFSDMQSGYKTKLLVSVSLYVQVIFIVYSFFGNPIYGINFMLPYTLFTALIGSYNNYSRMKNDESRNINISQHP